MIVILFRADIGDYLIIQSLIGRASRKCRIPGYLILPRSVAGSGKITKCATIACSQHLVDPHLGTYPLTRLLTVRGTRDRSKSIFSFILLHKSGQSRGSLCRMPSVT